MLEKLIDIINMLLPEPHASLLAGMLFGVRRNMPPAFYDALVATGTLHVIALSGMNVSIIIRILFDTAGTFLGRKAGVLITLAGIIGFIILVGPSPTIVRAGIMGSLTVVAALVGRKDIPLLSLFLAAGIMIMIDSSVVSNISFQLSFSATLGIILFGGSKLSTNEDIASESKTSTPVLSSKDHPIGKLGDRKDHLYGLPIYLSEFISFILSELRVTLSAQVFTVPIIWFYFHRVSLISPIANIAIGWLVPPITILGFIMVFFGYLWLSFGRIISFIVWPLLEVFIEVINVLSHVPMASVGG